MKQIKFLIMAATLAILLCCNNDIKNESKIIKPTIQSDIISKCPKYILDQKENNLNISVLLDLSDRIEKTKIKEKDSTYLSILSKIFIQHIKHKKLIMLEDRMQLFFNPEPSDKRINEISEKLKIVFTKQTSKVKIQETVSLYSKVPSELYDLAKYDAKNSRSYPGSDIWGFFKNNIKDYSIDSCHRNILVILTDGYMFYDKTVRTSKNRTSYLTPKSLKKLKLNKATWKEEMDKKDFGFIPASSELNNLEILVIGITSGNDENPYALDIIEAYWTKWFDDMGVKRYKIKNGDIPSHIEKVVSDFIMKT